MLRHPETCAEALPGILADYLKTISPWDELTQVADRQAREAAAHVLYMAGRGLLEAAIQWPQGQFPVLPKKFEP